MGRVNIAKDHTIALTIEPDSFVSTKAILRPGATDDESQ
jgi:hypothetical protein